MEATGVPRPAVVDPHVAALSPAQLLQFLPERRNAGLRLRVIAGQVHEHADAPHALALLRRRRARPRNCRAAEERDELAPFPVEHGTASQKGVTNNGYLNRRPESAE